MEKMVFALLCMGMFDGKNWVEKLLVLDVMEVKDNRLPPPPIDHGVILDLPPVPKVGVNLIPGCVVCDSIEQCEEFVKNVVDDFIESAKGNGDGVRLMLKHQMNMTMN